MRSSVPPCLRSLSSRPRALSYSPHFSPATFRPLLWRGGPSLALISSMSSFYLFFADDGTRICDAASRLFALKARRRFFFPSIRRVFCFFFNYYWRRFNYWARCLKKYINVFRILHYTFQNERYLKILRECESNSKNVKYKLFTSDVNWKNSQ